jgi:zinc protease
MMETTMRSTDRGETKETTMKAPRKSVALLSLFFLLAFSCVSPGKGAANGPSLASAESPRATPSPQAQAPQAVQPKAAQTAQPKATAKGESAPSPEPAGEYYLANAPSISEYSLDNGIPVVVKKNEANKVFALKVVLRGTSALVPREKAGIEAVTLQTMARGSARYSYDKLSSLAYLRSSAIGASGSSYDQSSFDLVTFDKYFDETFDAFASCFLEPSLAESDFRTVLASFKAARAQTMSDPYGYATSLLHAAAFKDHAYASDPQGTDDSIASFTLDDVRAHYRNLVGPERLAIVAVGNFDGPELVKKLNATFGTLPRKAIRLPEAKRYEAKRDVILAPFAQSPGIAYVRGDFPIPAPGDKDWQAYALGASILNDLLFDVVRTKYGACYTPFASTFGFLNPYGSIGIYKTSKANDVKAYIDEAVSVLASGRTPNLKRVPGLDYAPLADTIEAYKAKYVNGFYAKQQTNIEVAGQIASSLVSYGSAAEYLKAVDKLKKVKAEDVVKAVRKYIVDGKITWIVVTDQAGLDAVRKDPWLKPAGQ